MMSHSPLISISIAQYFLNGYSFDFKPHSTKFLEIFIN